MSIFSIAGSTPSDEGFELKSARLDYNSSPQFAKTMTTTGTSVTTGTFSWWAKMGKLGANQCMWCVYYNNSKPI